jgi:AraC-like DNA-binding protein
MPIDQIAALPSNDGVERMSAIFQRFSFSRHRHDTYAIGITTGGIQAFTYRGAARHSIRGRAFVLHPDEQHDGRAGDARGYSYHIAYIDPSLILAATEGKCLPFVREPVSNDEQLCDAVRDLLSATSNDVEGELATACSIAALSDILSRMAGLPSTRISANALNGVRAARDALLGTPPGAPISISALERLSGMNRWQLARQFRSAYGVSPYRFQLLQRLRQARDLLLRGKALAEIAVVCGFADQAHMSRHFRNAYGVSPGQWRALIGRTSPCAAAWSR